MVRSLSRRSTPEKKEGSVLGYSETLNVLQLKFATSLPGSLILAKEEIARLRTTLSKFERIHRATMSLKTATSRYCRQF